MGSVVARLAVAVGAFVSAQDIGDGDDSLGVVDVVEDSPVALSNSVTASAQFDHPIGPAVLSQAGHRFTDAGTVRASDPT